MRERRQRLNRYGEVRVRSPGPIKRARGIPARMQGRRAEVFAALMLMLKGYCIICFRMSASLGEVDIVAARRTALAIIEVKRRRSIEEALDAVTPQQRYYLRQAGRQISATRIGLRDFWVRLDLIAIAPGRLPRHIPDAWPGDAPSR